MLKKILKWTGITLLVLLVIIIALPFMFKGKIVKMAKEEANSSLNAKVDFGDFSLTMLSSFPNFTFSINDVSVVGKGEFAGDTLAGIKKLSLTVDLMSVIHGKQYKIRKIYLDHPHILAKVLKNGDANWNITKPSKDTTTQSSSQSSPFKMKLKKLEITDGNIVYDDATLGFKMSMIGLNHTLSGDFTQDNFVLHTVSAIRQLTVNYGGVDYLHKVNTHLDADMDVNMPKFKFTFKQDKISLNDLNLGVDGYFAMPGSDMDMDLKVTTKDSKFKSILSLIPAVYAKDFASVKTSGTMSLNAYVKGVYNDKKMPGFGAHVKINNGMFKYPSLPKEAKNIAVDINVDDASGVPDNTVIDIKKFHVEMAGNPLDVKMHISTPVSDPDIDGRVLGRVDLASIKDVIPLQKGDNLNGNITADVTMKGKMSSIEKEHYDQFDAKGHIIVMDMNYKTKSLPYNMDISKMYLNFSPQSVALSSFAAKIGKSDISANGKIDNFLQYMFKKQLLKGEFNMQSHLLDLNQFMTSSDASSSSADTTAMAVVEVPANIDFTMNATIGKLLFEKIEMDQVNGGLRIHDRMVDMTGLKMNMMGGSMTMHGTYKTTDPKKPQVDFYTSVSNFDIPQTFNAFNTVQKLAPIGKYAKGRFSTNLHFTTDLTNNMEPDYNTLNGNGDLTTKHVVVEGFKPIDKMADALKNPKYKKLDMSDVKLTYSFKNGRVYVNPFKFKEGNVKGQIAGSNGFDETIDYVMALQIPRSDFGGAANTALNGLVSAANSKGAHVSVGNTVNVNVKFGGTVTKPTVGLGLKKGSNDDVVAQMKQQAEAQAKAAAKAAADSLKKVAAAKAKAAADKAKAQAAAEAKAAADKAKADAAAAAKAAADKAKQDAKNTLNGLFGKHKHH